jgi:hypothetical protein
MTCKKTLNITHVCNPGTGLLHSPGDLRVTGHHDYKSNQSWGPDIMPIEVFINCYDKSLQNNTPICNPGSEIMLSPGDLRVLVVCDSVNEPGGSDTMHQPTIGYRGLTPRACVDMNLKSPF